MPSSDIVAKTSRAGSSKLAYTIRAYLADDAGAVVNLAGETRDLDPGAPVLDAARWRFVCADPYADPEAHFRVAETDDGRLLGIAYRFDPPRPDGGSYRATFVVVHPKHRRRGIGRELFDAIAGDGGRDGDTGWYLTTTIDEASSAAWPFARSLGFKRAQSLLVMERPLPGRPLPEPDSDARIERFLGATAWQDWADIHNASFQGVPFAVRHDPDALEGNRPDDFRPEHVRFAKLSGKRVGYLFLRETTGGGYVESIGVLPDVRGQGIGTALLVSALEYLVDRGHRQVALTVDDGNRAALKMYARLGFDEVSRRAHLKRGAKAPRRRSRRS